MASRIKDTMWRRIIVGAVVIAIAFAIVVGAIEFIDYCLDKAMD